MVLIDVNKNTSKLCFLYLITFLCGAFLASAKSEIIGEMKVVLIGPIYPYRGGIAHFTAALSEALEDQAVETTIISYKKLYPKFLYPGKDDKDYGGEAPDPKVNFIFSPFDWRDWQATLGMIKDISPDLVIFQWWVSAWSFAYQYMFRQLKKNGIRFKVIVHNVLPHEPKWYDVFLSKWVFAQVPEVICLSEKEATRLKTELGYGGKVVVSPHPIYKGFGSSTKTREQFISELKIAETDKIVLFFGIVRPYKGLGDLIEAIGILRKMQVPVTLVVAGEFWMKEDVFKAQVERLGIKDRVKIVNRYIPDLEVAQYFENADLFVAPYTAGTQSGALKLAMGYGLPAVITDVIEDELVVQFRDAILILPPSRPDLLADAIVVALKIKADRSKQHDETQSNWKPLVTTILDQTDLC